MKRLMPTKMKKSCENLFSSLLERANDEIKINSTKADKKRQRKRKQK